MYSKENIETALKLYHQCGSVTKATRVMGYPSKREFYEWILNEGADKPARKKLLLVNMADHPRNSPLEVKMEAIHRCLELGESVKSVSEEIGYSRASIYIWRKRYLKGGTAALMNNKNIKPDTLTESSTAPISDLAQL